MDEPQPAPAYSPLEREKALFLYRGAIARGDFETVERVLHEAETDVLLERMILDSHALDIIEEAEAEVAATGWDMTAMRADLAFHLSDASTSTAPSRALPVTLADVANRMESEAAPGREFADLTARLRALPLPLPDSLDAARVSQLFHNLGLASSDEFQNEFLTAVRHLERGRGA